MSNPFSKEFGTKQNQSTRAQIRTNIHTDGAAMSNSNTELKMNDELEPGVKNQNLTLSKEETIIVHNDGL